MGPAAEERLRAATTRAAGGEPVRYQAKIRPKEDGLRTIALTIRAVHGAIGNVVELICEGPVSPC